MTDDTEIEWHQEQIAKNRVLLEELEAGNTAGGDVFPETQSEIEHLKAQITPLFGLQKRAPRSGRRRCPRRPLSATGSRRH
jgi:hypothetical protein